jgi:hypothetical protein
MPAAGLGARECGLHRVPRRRGRYRTAVAGTIRAAMSMSPAKTGCTNANARCATRSRTCSASGANPCSATCSGAAARSPSSTAAAASSAASKQRTGCCDQQCRYGGHRDKLGDPDHDDLLRH